MRAFAVTGMLFVGWGCPAPDGPTDGDGDSDSDVDADSDADTDTSLTCFPAGTPTLDEICARPCASAADCDAGEDCWLVNGCPGGSKGVCGTATEACRAEGCAGPCCNHIGANPGKVTSCEPAAICCG